MKIEEFEALVTDWLKALSQEEYVPEKIKALNFGMFEAENGYVVHLYGSEEYDPKDDSWSYNEDYVPQKRCIEFNQKEVREMYWEDFQNLIAKLLRSFIKADTHEEFQILKLDHITTGFDDGDLIIIK